MRRATTGGTMGCTPWVEALSARLDGELAPSELPALDDHLAGCSTCRDLAARLEHEHRRWRLRAAPAIPDLAGAMLAAAPSAAGGRRSAGVLAAIAGGAVAAAAVAGAVLVVNRPARPPVLTIGNALVAAAVEGGVSVVDLTVTNAGGSDRVVGAGSPVAERTEIHEIRRGPGVTVMRSVTSVAVPSGVGAEFSGSSTHLMLVGLREDLRPGSRVTILLRFARAGEVTIDATVAAASAI